jgi:hypothetical protein
MIAVDQAVTAWSSAATTELFFSHVHMHGGPAPVRHFLPELIDLIWNRQIYPGMIFDLSLPIDQAAEGRW